MRSATPAPPGRQKCKHAGKGNCGEIGAVATFSHVRPPPDPGPELAVNVLLRTLSYGYNVRDTCINLFVLGLCVVSLCSVTATGDLTLSALFWVPTTVLIASLQCIVTVLAEQQGFSLVWAVLAGLMLYEQVRHDVFTDAGPSIAVLALVNAAVAGSAISYYLVEELFWFEVPDGGERCPALCWYRTGTTAVHLMAVGIGGLAGLAADSTPSRVSPFWTVVGMAAVALVALPCVLLHLRRLQGSCGLASVVPDVPTPLGRSASLQVLFSDEELAIASLQAQLLKTREQIAHARHRTRQPEAASAGAAGGVVASSSSGGGGPPTTAPAAAPTSTPADAPADEAAMLTQTLATLQKREALLLERLMAHATSATQHQPQPAEGASEALSAATGGTNISEPPADAAATPSASPHLMPEPVATHERQVQWIGGGPRPRAWRGVGRTKTQPAPPAPPVGRMASPALIA